MPANISIVGLTNVLNFLEENSDRNSAPDTPKGIAISKEPPAIRAVPASKGKVPNFGKRPFGIHSEPNKNSERLVSAGSPSSFGLGDVKKSIVPFNKV